MPRGWGSEGCAIISRPADYTNLTPTWAFRLLTRLARLFWSLASVSVVLMAGSPGTGSGVFMSSGRMPKLGVSGLMELLNMLRKRRGLSRGDMVEHVLKWLVRFCGLSSRDECSRAFDRPLVP